jgi:hypothetical protein
MRKRWKAKDMSYDPGRRRKAEAGGVMRTWHLRISRRINFLITV